MIGLSLGLGMGGRAAGGGASVPANTTAPSIDANGYPGGTYTFSEGIWTGSPTLTMTLESSADGVSGWTDQGAVSSTGTWAAGLAGLYVRLKVVPNAGATAYSVPFGPLGLAYNQVLNFAGNGNYLSHAVTAPFIGADLAAATSGASSPGFWLMAMWYYDGAGPETGAALVSLGNTTTGTTQAELNPAGVGLWRAGGTSGGSGFFPSPVGAPGWYLTTGHYYNSGAAHASSAYVNELSHVGTPTGTNLVLTNFTTLRIGDQASNAPSTATNFDERIGFVAFGRGSPAAAHAWTYNGGQMRRVDGYDFGADAAATIEGFIPLYRESPGNTTFVAGDAVDTIGAFDSWTLTGTLAYENRVPGFINPAGDPPATPSRYIYPKYASTSDATFTLGINTKAIGTAVAGDFTVTALTHSVAGDISGTVTGTTFPNPGAGTITGTISGVSVAVEIVAPLALPADPQFRTRYDGNARVAGIEPYTSPGAGTTYANVAALKAGIDALGAGATLIVADLSDVATLTLTAKDYGGATVTCTNLHGVKLGGVSMANVIGLTIRGVDVLTHGGTFAGNIGVSGVTLDHCTGKALGLGGTTGATETIKISNWIGPDDGTAGKLEFLRFNRVTLHRVAHANTASTTADVVRTDACNILMADRFYFGQVGTIPGAPPFDDPHPDCWQTVGSGTSGAVGGLIMNGVMIDLVETSERGAQGLFLSDISAQNLRALNVATHSGLTNSIVIANARQACGIENCTGNGAVVAGGGGVLSFSFYAKDNIRGGTTAVLPSAGVGTETGTVNTTMTPLFPNFTVELGNWQMWEGPTGAAVGKGAHALITELVANRAIAP